MNFKYYLRGLGLGIIVTTIVLGLSFGKKEIISNAEIIARAKELGMIEDKVLSRYQEGQESEIVKEDKGLQTQEVNEKQGETESAELDNRDPEMIEAETVESDTKEPEVKEPEVKEPEVKEPEIIIPEIIVPEITVPKQEITQENKATTVDRIDVEIKSGDASHTVSKKLEAVGIITSAKEFDQFLVQNGYDKKIVVGIHAIPIDADFETIGKIVTTR